MVTKNLNIHNPERLNSKNHCLSDLIIELYFEKETNSEYVYQSNICGIQNFCIKIDKKITDNEVYIRIFPEINKNYISSLYMKPIEFCKDRNLFLDWLIKSIEAESSQLMPF